MKTIFKVKQKVYDQLNFPDIEGKVSEVDSKDYKGFPIKVWFSNTSAYYTNDGREEFNAIPTLSTKPYEVEFKGFEQRESVPDFYDIYDRFSEVFLPINYDENYYGYPTQELADASEALRQLIFLRDYYNNGWQPDWKDSNEKKFYIRFYDYGIFDDTTYTNRHVLSFKSRKVIMKFIEEQEELLKIARPLL